MCDLNKHFELLEFVFYSVYVDLQYDEISRTFTAGSVSVVMWSTLVCCCCMPSETYGRNVVTPISDLFTELTVPPQAAGVVETFLMCFCISF